MWSVEKKIFLGGVNSFNFSIQPLQVDLQLFSFLTKFLREVAGNLEYIMMEGINDELCCQNLVIAEFSVSVLGDIEIGLEKVVPLFIRGLLIGVHSFIV